MNFEAFCLPTVASFTSHNFAAQLTLTTPDVINNGEILLNLQCCTVVEDVINIEGKITSVEI